MSLIKVMHIFTKIPVDTDVILAGARDMKHCLNPERFQYL